MYCSHLSNSSHQMVLFKVTKSKKLAKFNRAMVYGNILHSLEHKQPKKRNSYTAIITTIIIFMEKFCIL